MAGTSESCLVTRHRRMASMQGPDGDTEVGKLTLERIEVHILLLIMAQLPGLEEGVSELI